MKDIIDPMDRVDAIYRVECNQHKDIYIGKTECTLRVRAYEHKVIPHNQAVRNHTLNIKEPEEQGETEEVTDEEPRRSTRLKTKDKINYKRMHEGEKIVEKKEPDEAPEEKTEPSPVAEHVRQYEHKHDDLTIKTITYEHNWYIRGIKEAIEINKNRP